jgi:hypothetical protein
MSMIWLPRVAALLSFVLTGLTALRPRTGWGRLVFLSRNSLPARTSSAVAGGASARATPAVTGP